MTHYRIGLRVRIIKCENAPFLLGTETTIDGETTVGFLGLPLIPAWTLDIPDKSGGRYCCPKSRAGDCLAPIIDPNEKCDPDFAEEFDKQFGERTIQKPERKPLLARWRKPNKFIT